MERIVCIVEGDLEHHRALAYAVKRAGCHAPAELEAVAVAPPEPVLATAPSEPLFAWPPDSPVGPGVPAWQRGHDQREAAREHRVREPLDAAIARLPRPEGVSISTRVLPHARHVEAIAELAVDADLVVVTSHRGLDPAVLHTERIVRHLLRETGVAVTLVP